ncbi:hypothetical protein H6F89_28585 [Cyanobacteria bacterium FACHB-63]|nr:hypothetical protein [Cyanobacteria bacterium FACHB-63]
MKFGRSRNRFFVQKWRIWELTIAQCGSSRFRFLGWIGGGSVQRRSEPAEFWHYAIVLGLSFLDDQTVLW